MIEGQKEVVCDRCLTKTNSVFRPVDGTEWYCEACWVHKKATEAPVSALDDLLAENERLKTELEHAKRHAGIQSMLLKARSVHCDGVHAALTKAGIPSNKQKEFPEDSDGLGIVERVELAMAAHAHYKKALSEIASGSPSILKDGSIDRRCAMCATHIDHAREALDWALWPAIPGTPATAAPSTAAPATEH